MTRICAGVVASKGVTVSHAGAGVPGAPLSTSRAKSMAELDTEVTVTTCVGGFGPLAIAVNARLELESCSAGFCASPDGIKASIPKRTRHHKRLRYFIGN